MKKYTYIILLLTIIGLFACKPTKPQSPSNKTQEIDSTQIEMMLMNFRLAEAADAELIKYVRSSAQQSTNLEDSNNPSIEYTLHQWGFWYRKILRNEQPILTEGEEVEIHYQVYSFDNQLLIDSQENIQVGKRQVIMAIEQMLPLMHQEEQAELLAPWYLAYGSTEEAGIAPYTNVRILLTVL